MTIVPPPLQFEMAADAYSPWAVHGRIVKGQKTKIYELFPKPTPEQVSNIFFKQKLLTAPDAILVCGNKKLCLEAACKTVELYQYYATNGHTPLICVSGGTIVNEERPGIDQDGQKRKRSEAIVTGEFIGRHIAGDHIVYEQYAKNTGENIEKGLVEIKKRKPGAHNIMIIGSMYGGTRTWLTAQKLHPEVDWGIDYYWKEGVNFRNWHENGAAEEIYDQFAKLYLYEVVGHISPLNGKELTIRAAHRKETPCPA